ncbi:MAG: sodium:calcium antiporter, partial [Gemmatimonadota bacterium]|nr:sodium:calcium antiporter [Gemmatimonadota bacterium]
MARDLALFVLGITLLTLGADWLVRGASKLAERLGVSSLIVGLTVVAFGTSAPELVVSAAASLNDQAQIAVGNVMGSTAANVGLIVALGALVRPIGVHRRLVVRETPLVIIVLSVVMVLSLNDALGRLDGLALVSGFVLYRVFLLRWGGGGIDRLAREIAREESTEPPEPSSAAT